MGADQKQGLPCYYSILGVSSESSINEIKRAYRKLAMQWHPDRLTRTPSILGEANRKFQRIQEAYAVLSDHRKRAMYDAGLYDPEDQEDEGLSDFVQEMLNLMAQDRRQDKSYSTEELQTMLLEMARGFETSSWHRTPSILEEPRNSKRARYDANRKMDSGGSHISLSGWGVVGIGITFGKRNGHDVACLNCWTGAWGYRRSGRWNGLVS
ncbi:hypothetical protein OIU77_014223 [Salix suchowensis]|uniref:J domain-containing protein n=1 Tax=Salix suchowensis TaxID=1278906 RepID=A0ABQ8ZWK5_9ROSI|nr:hypothetical protein OIU77_014223 [Salix suchowensis]KAJ6356769.1 hypothetical protein OIU78_004799 [Salix suchowensis]